MSYDFNVIQKHSQTTLRPQEGGQTMLTGNGKGTSEKCELGFRRKGDDRERGMLKILFNIYIYI